MRAVQALAVLAALTASGCGGVNCTSMACVGGFGVELDPQLTAPGTYTFELSLDGQPVECTAVLPYDADAPASCDDDRVMIGYEPDLPEAKRRYEAIIVHENPTAVDVTVSRDDVEIGSDSFDPTYTRFYPNGEACGGYCESASATLSITD